MCIACPVCWDSSTALALVWPGSTMTDVRLRISRMVNIEITLLLLNALVLSWSRQHCWERWIRVRVLGIPAVSVISSLNPIEYLWEHVLAVCFFLHLYLLSSPPSHPWWASRGERNHRFDGVLFFQQPSRAPAHTIKNNNGAHRWSGPGSKRLIRDRRPLLTPRSC